MHSISAAIVSGIMMWAIVLGAVQAREAPHRQPPGVLYVAENNPYAFLNQTQWRIHPNPGVGQGQMSPIVRCTPCDLQIHAIEPDGRVSATLSDPSGPVAGFTLEVMKTTTDGEVVLRGKGLQTWIFKIGPQDTTVSVQVKNRMLNREDSWPLRKVAYTR